MFNDFSKERLIELLKISNKKIKSLKSTLKRVLKQRNDLQNKLSKIETLLKETTYYFDRYDYPSDSEHYTLRGKLELKEDILKIINKAE